VDEGFRLWGADAVYGAKCTSDGVGGCARQGWVKCNAAGDAFDCCAVDDGASCDAADVIPENPEPAMSDEAGSIPDGVDDDCDGVADDGADGCVAATGVVRISGTETGGEYDIFAFEATRRGAAEAPCSELTGDPLPWTNISFSDARDACLRLNSAESDCSYTNPDENADACWDLCSAEQWFFACAYWGDLADAPHLYPYGDTYDGATCNGDDYGEGGVIATGAATGCASEWGDNDVMDMSGNVEEWTLDLRTVGDADLRVIRGGSYKTIANGMTCDFNFFAADETALQMDQLGFRCCRGSDPLTACDAAINTTLGSPFDFDIVGAPDRCTGDGWWADSASGNDWQFGKTTAALVGTDSCVYATLLNDNYSHSNTSDLLSSALNLSSCAGETILLTWDMWFNNGLDAGDVLSLQVRSSNDSGDAWTEWTDIASFATENLNWTTRFSATVVDTVSATALYQLRFRFTTNGSTNSLGVYLDNLALETN
jgi:hypothetical protein